jgi:hypothetical protein
MTLQGANGCNLALWNCDNLMARKIAWHGAQDQMATETD